MAEDVLVPVSITGKKIFIVEFKDRDKKYRCREIEISGDTLSEEGAKFWLEQEGFKKITRIISIRVRG